MKKLILLLIKGYQKTPIFQEIYKTVFFTDKVCRFEPSCSNYAYQAVEKYGVLKGLYLGTKRIIRCNPFSKGGFDPVK
jgi:hypothetical protein